KVQCVGNWRWDGGGLDEDLEIIRAEGVDTFSETLPPDVVQVDIVPGSSPIKTVLKWLCGKTFRKWPPHEPALTGLNARSRAGATQQKQGDYQKHHGVCD